MAKKLEKLGDRLNKGNGSSEDAAMFKSLLSKWSTQKYTPKEGLTLDNQPAGFEKPGTAGSIFKRQKRDERAPDGKGGTYSEGTPMDKYGYDFSYTAMQSLLNKNNTSSRSSRFPPPVKMPKIGGNNKGGLAKKKSGYNKGGVVHNDMRKGGLFK